MSEDVKVRFDLDVDSSSAKKATEETKKLEAAIKAAAAADDKAAAASAAAALAQKNKAAEMISAAYQRSRLNESVARIEAKQAAALKVGGGFASATSAMRASSAAQAVGMEKQNALSELSAQFTKREAAAHLMNKSAYESFKSSLLGAKGPRDTGADARYNVKGSGASGVMSKVLGGAESLFGKGSSNVIMEALGGITKADDALVKMGTSLSGVAGVGLGAVSIGAAVAVTGVLALAAAVGVVVFGLSKLAVEGTVAFAKFAVSTASFREDSLVAFEAMLKSKGAALAAYNSAIEMADVTPFETQPVISAYKTLMAGGYGLGDTERIMKGLSDFAVVGGTDKLDQLAGAFARLKSEGKLSGEVMERLREARLPMDELAKALGKPIDKIAGTNADTTMTAILAVIDKRFGGGGDAVSKNISGLWSTISSKPFVLFNKALAMGGGGLSAFVTEIKVAMVDINKALSFGEGNGGDRIVAVINAIGAGMAAVARVAREFGTGLVEGLGKGWNAAGGSEATKGLDNMRAAANIGTAFREIGNAIGYVIGGATAIGFVFAAASATIDRHSATIKSVLLGIGVAVAALGLVVLSIATFFAMAFAPFIAGALIIGVVIAGIALAILAIPIAIGVAVGAVAYLISQVGGLAASFDAVGNSVRGALGFGGEGTSSPFSGMTLPGGFTLSSPVAAPSSLSQPAPSMSHGKGDQNITNTITVSGVGLDLSQLAQLIRSQLTQAMAEAGGL